MTDYATEYQNNVIFIVKTVTVLFLFRSAFAMISFFKNHTFIATLN